jgi:hypothetical protein
MLSVTKEHIMLSVVMLNVVMLNVVAPQNQLPKFHRKFCSANFHPKNVEDLNLILRIDFVPVRSEIFTANKKARKTQGEIIHKIFLRNFLKPIQLQGPVL